MRTYLHEAHSVYTVNTVPNPDFSQWALLSKN